MLTIHKCNLDKEAIKYLEIIKHYFEKEIKDVESGCKKTYTPNQLIKIHENLFKEIRHGIELNKNKRKRVYIIYNEQLARDFNIKVIRAKNSEDALEEARMMLEDEYGFQTDKTKILTCTDTGIEINE